MASTPPYVITGIEYAACGPGDTAEVGRLLAESFTLHDPPAVAVGLTSDEFEAFVNLWLPGAGTDGLTIVARDVASGQLAGALLTDDAAAPPPQGLDDVSHKFEPIFDLLDQIDTEYRQGTNIDPGNYLHLFLLGVADQFTRRSIGRHLVEACLVNGAAKGYTTAVTEATNPVSQHIFRTLGFEKRTERSYSDYRLDCQFESICETCAYYATDETFDPVLRAQRDHAAQRDQHHRVDLFQMLIDRNQQAHP